MGSKVMDKIERQQVKERLAILTKLYTSGDGADFTIQTGTKLFKLHKAIICASCPYFQAACNRDWQEANLGVITLPEPENIVDSLLRRIYGIYDPLDFDDAFNNLFPYHVELHIAADKYELPDFARETYAMLDHLVHSDNELYGSMYLVVWLWEDERRAFMKPDLLNEVLRIAAKDFSLLTEYEEDWAKVLACPRLVTDLMRYIALNPPSVHDMLEKSALRDNVSEYLKPAES